MRSDQTTRPTAAAGHFYPEEPDRLETPVLEYLKGYGSFIFTCPTPAL